MKPATFAPAYCALYPKLAELAREQGYALAVHGSLARDLDLVAIPWGDAPTAPSALVEAITTRFAIRLIGDGPTEKAHGRIAYSLSIAFGDCAVDLSFTPADQPTPPRSASEPTVEECLDVYAEAAGQFMTTSIELGVAAVRALCLKTHQPLSTTIECGDPEAAFIAQSTDPTLQPILHALRPGEPWTIDEAIRQLRHHWQLADRTGSYLDAFMRVAGSCLIQVLDDHAKLRSHPAREAMPPLGTVLAVFRMAMLYRGYEGGPLSEPAARMALKLLEEAVHVQRAAPATEPQAVTARPSGELAEAFTDLAEAVEDDYRKSGRTMVVEIHYAIDQGRAAISRHEEGGKETE